MALDKLPKGTPTVFEQRDVRETATTTVELGSITEDLDMNGNKIIELGAPASGGDATNKTYVDGLIVVDHNGLNNLDFASAGHTGFQATLTAGEGIDIVSTTISCEDSTAINKGIVIVAAGEGMNVSYSSGTATVSGEDATTSNKGIASFNTNDFAVSSGAVSLDDNILKTIDGDSGTATASGHNIDILGGTGISTVGASNDITITNDGVTSVAAGAGIDVSGATGSVTISAETATTTNAGIIEIATEDEVQTGTDTSRAVVPDTLQSVLPPIGAVIAWLKSFTNTPQTLPTGFVECDGSVLSDADSVYNGQTLPDLNGGEFLRGNTTSGGTGGSNTMAHTHNIPITYDGNVNFDSGSFTGSNHVTDKFEGVGDSAAEEPMLVSHGASNTENRPPYYDVVWIMRIK